MSRSLAATLSTTRSPISIEPALARSSPAMMFNSVDFPHPDGPSRTVNSPLSIERSIPLRTSTDPNRLCRPRTRSAAMPSPYFSAPAVSPRMKYCPLKKYTSKVGRAASRTAALCIPYCGTSVGAVVARRLHQVLRDVHIIVAAEQRRETDALNDMNENQRADGVRQPQIAQH